MRSVFRVWSKLPARTREAALAALLADHAQAIDLFHDWQLNARDDQLPPLQAANGKPWRTWLLLGGRGSGKTRAGAEWVRAVALGLWPGEARASRIALVGPTQAHVRSVMVEGVSGLLSVHPRPERPVLEISKGQLVWPSGAIAQFFSAEDPEGLRGPQFDAAWCDELGRWGRGHRAWDMLQFGLRLGTLPRQVVTTTPRATPLMKRIIADEATAITRARTVDNATNLAPAFIAEVNQGVGAARMLQEALGVEIDGEIGPVTLAAAADLPIGETLERYATVRRARYRSLHHFWRFGRGWLTRVDKALAQARSLVGAVPFDGADAPGTTPTPLNPQPQETTSMPDSSQPTVPPSTAEPKWWGSSLTIWGTLVTAISTVAPVVLAAFGLDVPGPLIDRLGADIIAVAQAAGGLVGTVMTILGRARATTPLTRRPIAIRI